MQLQLFLALGMTLLAQRACGDPADKGGKKQEGGCEGDFTKYVQCVYYTSEDAERGTYSHDVTRDTCNGYADSGTPTFYFDEDKRACYDKIGLGDKGLRSICNQLFAKACYDQGKKTDPASAKKKGGYGGNSGNTLDEMYSYADQQ